LSVEREFRLTCELRVVVVIVIELFDCSIRSIRGKTMGITHRSRKERPKLSHML
jgi:hypothetical protein